jgi:hypothetical protein
MSDEILPPIEAVPHFKERLLERLGLTWEDRRVERFVIYLDKFPPTKWKKQSGGRIKFKTKIGGNPVWVVFNTEKRLLLTVMPRLD